MTSYRRPQDVLVRRCPDRLLVLAGEQVHTLRATAVDLFEAIATPVDLDVVVDRMTRRYGQVSSDMVLDGLEALRATGLAERLSP